MSVAASVASTAEYYQKNSAKTVAKVNFSALVLAIVADVIFDLSNAYLHVMSLRLIPDASAVKRKLHVMSYSTMVSTGFSLTKVGLQLAGDVFGGMAMATLEATSLPAAVTLGEIVSARGNPTKSFTGSSSGASKTAGGKIVRGNSVAATDRKNSEGVRRQAELS